MIDFIQTLPLDPLPKSTTYYASADDNYGWLMLAASAFNFWDNERDSVFDEMSQKEQKMTTTVNNTPISQCVFCWAKATTDEPLVHSWDCPFYDVFEDVPSHRRGTIATPISSSEQLAKAIEATAGCAPDFEPLEERGLKLTIPSSAKRSKWRRVADKLPFPYQEVLVWDGGGEYMGYYSGVTKTWRIIFRDGDVEVTHWRPLPKPPKEG